MTAPISAMLHGPASRKASMISVRTGDTNTIQIAGELT